MNEEVFKEQLEVFIIMQERSVWKIGDKVKESIVLVKSNLNNEEKKIFYDQLETKMDDRNEEIIMMGDLNGGIDNNEKGSKEIFGNGSKNDT